MKKIWLLSIGLLFGFVVAHAQQHFMLSLTERAFQVIPTENKGFYTLTHQVNCPDDHIVIRYFNYAGQLQSEVRSPVYLGNINHLTAVCLPNTHLLMYMRDESINHLVYEFDSTGTQQWNRNFQLTQQIVAFQKLLPIPGGGFYLLGNYDINTINDSAKSVLVRCNAQGVVQWMKQFTLADGAKSYVKFNDLQWEQGHLLAAGYHYRSGNVGWAPKRPSWLRMDTAGNPIQAAYYMVDSSMIGFDEYEFMRLEPTPNGQYTALVYNSGNEHALIRLDTALNIRWIKEKLSGRVQAFCIGYNDEIYVVPDGQTGNMVLRLDSSGNYVSARKTPYSASFNDSSLYGAIMGITRYQCGFLLVNDRTLLCHNRDTMAYCDDSLFYYNPLYRPVTVFTRKPLSLQVQAFGPYNVYLGTPGYTTQTSAVQTWCSSSYTCGTTPNAVNTVDPNKGFQVYPTLYQTHFTLETPDTEPWDVSVHNFQGQRIDHKVIQGQTVYSVSGDYGVSGQFLLRIQRQEKVFTTRITCVR